MTSSIIPAAVILALALGFCQGCDGTVTEVDGGKWGDLAQGGDVSELHDPGTFCKTWSPADYSPPPSCHGAAETPACSSWIKAATPPNFPIDYAECDTTRGVCDATPAFSHIVTCNSGKAGDDYCAAWAEAWMKPGVNVHANCVNRGDPSEPSACDFLSCDPSDPHGLQVTTKFCDPTEMCVVHDGGSFSCETPCSSP